MSTPQSYDTDVLVIGSGPADGTAALLLATYGVRTHLVTKYGWLADTPRAHITNQRAMEVFRDLGIEQEALEKGTPSHLMGDTVFATSLLGEEIGRIRTWGTGDESLTEHAAQSPCGMIDLPQTYLEPILLANAAKRGAVVRLNTELVDFEQDADGVTATLRDRAVGTEYTVRARYMIGADGGPEHRRGQARTAHGGADGQGRQHEHRLQGRPRAVRRAPAQRPVLDHAPGRRRRRDRHGPAAHGPALERVAHRLGLRHRPSRPGAKLPHAWLVDQKGGRVSTLDLVGKGSFSVLTGLAGTQWAEAADALARELGLDLRGIVIDRDAHDAYGEWSRRAEIDEEGVLLVRPDGYVAWRRPSGAADITEATRLLREALTTVLCRPA